MRVEGLAGHRGLGHLTTLLVSALLLLGACSEEGGGDAAAPSAGSQGAASYALESAPGYEGTAKLKVAVLNGGVEHAADVAMKVVLHPGGKVTGTLVHPLIDLMTGNLREPHRQVRLEGTHGGGAVTISSIDARGRRDEGWIQGSIEEDGLHLKGSKTAEEIGLVVRESVEAKLRPR